MRKLLIFMLVLGMASAANAVLKISVDGVVDPCDTTIILDKSDTVIIDIWGDGTDSPQTTAPWLLVLDIEGSGSIAGHNMLYGGSLTSYSELEDIASDIGMTVPDTIAAFEGITGYSPISDMSGMELMDGTENPPALDGKLVDEIIFHCEGYGDVLLVLLGEDLSDIFVHDTQLIHQIPEPATMALLGLGGLLLVRRRK
jgi:hypothetical protein